MLFGLIDVTYIKACIANSDREMRRGYRDRLRKCESELSQALRRYDEVGGFEARDEVFAKYGEAISACQIIEGGYYVTNYCYLLLRGQMNRLRRWAANEIAARLGKDVLKGKLSELMIYLEERGSVSSRARGEIGRFRRIVVPEGITRIEKNKFDMLKRLRAVTLPDSLVEIEDFAFLCCRRLRYVSIGRGIEKIGEGAFGACHKRLHIKFRGHVQEWESKNFTDIASPYTRGQVSCIDGSLRIN